MSPIRPEATELADEIRALLDAVVRSGADAHELEEARRVIAAVRQDLSTDLREGPRPRHEVDLSTGLHPLNPGGGAANPFSPPLDITIDGDGVVARATLGATYEGPPGHVHGGVLSLIFDQLLGMANVVAGTPGMTAQLEIRYRRPTPLWTELTFDCRHSGVEGRKILAEGVAIADGVETATATGTFLLPRSRSATPGTTRFSEPPAS